MKSLPSTARLALVFLCLVATATAAEKTATPRNQGLLEHRLIHTATQDVLAGKLRDALARIRDGLNADADGDAKLAERAFIVAAWLRNQSAYGAAEAFAVEALDRELPPADRLADSGEKAQGLYWRAKLALDILGRTAQAREFLADADGLDPDSDRISELRLRLVEAAVSFPEN